MSASAAIRRIVLLPGLDGTGALFEPFLSAAPAGVWPEAVALPAEPLGYAAFAARLADRVRPGPDTVLVAESFSGPIAVALAARHQVAALVLCNSFDAPPRPGLLLAPLHAVAAAGAPLFFRLRPPAALVRGYMVGPGAPDELVERVRAAVASVPPAVLAARLRAVVSVDAAGELARCGAPLLYVRGTEDRLVTEASVRAVLAAARGTAEVARLPGPHLLLQTAPQAAWRAISGWLAGLPPGAPGPRAGSEGR